MKFPLRLRLLIAYLLTLVVSFVLLATLEHALIEKQAENDVRDELYRDASYVAMAYRGNSGSVNREFLSTVAQVSGAEVWIMNLNGMVVATSNPEDAAFEVPEFRVSDGAGGYYMRGTFYGTHKEEVLTVYATLTKEITVNGYILLHYPAERIREAADRMQFFAYMTYWIFAGLVTLLFIWIDLSIVRPIQRVATAGR